MSATVPIVIVAGPPASGKTTIATAIADALRLPLLAKDPIKERLADSLGGGGGDDDVAWSRRLGGATYAVLFEVLAAQLRAGRPVVVEGTFASDTAGAEFRRLAARSPFEALQVHCDAPASVLLERYAARASGRHPAHADVLRLDDVGAGIREGRWGPLDLPGRCVRLETTVPDADDIARLVELARTHVERSTPARNAPTR